MDSLYIKKQPTLEELIAIKPRLCWVWQVDKSGKYVVAVSSYNDLYSNGTLFWNNAQMLTDDEIKQFLSGEWYG